MQIVLETLNEVILQASYKSESVAEKVSELIYRQLINTYPTHLLVRLKALLSLEDLAQKCSAYRTHEVGKRGVEATYEIRLLCGCLIVRHLYGWSYQTTADKIVGDLFLRFFIGFTLFESTPSASTIRLFEEWIKKNHCRLFFDEILRIIDELFPEERTKKQYGDTFAMFSRAAKQSRNAMMREAARRLLNVLSAAHPDLVERVCSSEQRATIFGENDRPTEEGFTLAKRKKIEICTAKASYLLLNRLEIATVELSAANRPLSPTVQKWSVVLNKVLHDEFTFSVDKNGDATPKRREKYIKGSYRLGSIVDVEATFRNHGKRSDLAYNVNVSATDRFVREIAAVTGAVPDANGIPELLTEQLKHLGIVPPKLIYDSAAGYPIYFSRVHYATNGQTELVTRLINHNKNSDRFGPLDFTVGEESQLTCPAGVVSTTAYLSTSNDGYNYRFRWGQCNGCALIQKCRGDKVKEGNPRNVFISLYRKIYRQALAYTETESFKEEYRERSHIERIIAGNTRYNGSRRARGYGTKSADFQAKMGAMAYNVKRLVKILNEQEKPQNRNRGSPNE